MYNKDPMAVFLTTEIFDVSPARVGDAAPPTGPVHVLSTTSRTPGDRTRCESGTGPWTRPS